MKRLLILLLFILCFIASKAQNGANANNAVVVSKPQIFQKWISIAAYNTGGLPAAASCPRCVVFNTDSLKMAVSNGTTWTYPGSGSGSGGTWGTITGNINSQTDLQNEFANYVRYSDTLSMFQNYLKGYVLHSDSAAFLASYALTANVVKYTDTTAMLNPYLLIANFTPANIGLGSVLNRKQVINLGGWDSVSVGTFGSLPTASAGPTFFYATDTNALYYNNKSAYTKITGGSGGGGSDDSVHMASRYYVQTTFVPINIYNQHGVDSVLGYTPYNSTNPNGYISANQVITLTPSGDVKGKASGSTAINSVDTVIGLEDALLPSLSSGPGKLSYNSGWFFDNTNYLPAADTASLSSRINTKQGSITLPDLPDYYYNGFGAMVHFSSDSVPVGSTNLYFTNALARVSISLSTNGLPTYNNSSGVLTIPAELDSMFRTPGKDSICFTIGGRRGCILDSATTLAGTVQNSGGANYLGSGPYTSAPSAALGPGFYYATDTGSLFYSNGTSYINTNPAFIINTKRGIWTTSNNTIVLGNLIHLDSTVYFNLGNIGSTINAYWKFDSIGRGMIFNYLNPASTGATLLGRNTDSSLAQLGLGVGIAFSSGNIIFDQTISPTLTGNWTFNNTVVAPNIAAPATLGLGSGSGHEVDVKPGGITELAVLATGQLSIPGYIANVFPGSTTTDTVMVENGGKIRTLPIADFGLTGNPLSQFAATTSAQLFGVLTNATGTAGFVVFSVSPALTGTPTVPTASPGTNTTQAASTAFVEAAVSASGNSFVRQNIVSGTSATGTNTVSNLKVNFGFTSTASVFTFTFPPSPIDGQTVEFYGDSTMSYPAYQVTTLTVSPNSGQSIKGTATLNTLQCGEYAKFEYIASSAAWLRDQ